MAIQTLNTAKLAEETGNLYESLTILSKRARQVAMRTKDELDQKLSVYEDLTMDPAEELRSNEDQYRISLEYEKKDKAPKTAVDEFLGDRLYYRNPTAEEGEG